MTGPRRGNRRTHYQFCITCEAPLRPGKTSEQDWPGTVPHKGRGLCSKCYYLERRDKAPNIELREEIEFLLETGDTKESLYRNTEIARMAIEYVFKALKIVE